MLIKSIILILIVSLIFGCQVDTQPSKSNSESGGCGLSTQGIDNCELINNTRYCGVTKEL